MLSVFTTTFILFTRNNMQDCYKLVIQSNTYSPTTETTFGIYSVAWKRFANSFQNSNLLFYHITTWDGACTCRNVLLPGGGAR